VYGTAFVNVNPDLNKQIAKIPLQCLMSDGNEGRAEEILKNVGGFHFKFYNYEETRNNTGFVFLEIITMLLLSNGRPRWNNESESE
jgi:hypothetical protein